MRYWNFGIFDSQAADFNGLFMGSARSILSLEDNTTDQVSSSNDWNPTGVAGTAQVGFEPGVNPLHYLALIKIDIGLIKAKLGQVPILVKADLGLVAEFAKTAQARVYRMYSGWDDGDTNSRYKDVSLSTTWYEDTYGPYPGQDREVTPTYLGPAAQSIAQGERVHHEITPLVETALRDNEEMNMMIWYTGANVVPFLWKPPITSQRPTLEFWYVYPVEFYRDDGSGDLDLTSPVSDNLGDEYYLGTAEPGSTGSAVKCHLRNYSGATKHIEVFDDHPEFTTPISRIGSGQLDFVNLSDSAVSQKYTCVFYSSTQYEILAEAYKDNAVSLHPQIDADSTWRGTVGADKSFPSPSGLTIKAAAWQPGTALDDEYETGVRGQTTDDTWPADANDQVEITYDNAGVADATAWRLCIGHRELTAAQVTIDATTKLIPTRMVVPTDWPATTKAFIMDATNINEGAISSVQEADIGAPSFSGTGSDDITISGNYNGVWTNTLRIKIDGTGTPNTFTWSIDGGSTWEATGVDCSTTDILLQDGIYVKWTSTTGHVLDDYWDSVIKSWAIELSGLTANSNVYNAGSRIGTTLPLRSVSAATFTSVDADSGVSQGTPARLYLTSTTGFTIGEDVYIATPGEDENWEIREIDSVQAGEYVDFTVAMTKDFSPGDFATVVGTGEEAFWSRPVATAITAEERKDLRFNARML